MIPIEILCDNCGNPFLCKHKKRLEHKHIFCSRKCEAEYRKNHNPNYIPCPVCGKKHYVKPRDQKKLVYGSCCSYECMGELRQIVYDGANNPNYGNRGSHNPIWKSDSKISPYCYMLIRMPEHPFANCDGFVFEHRLIAEQNLLTPETTVIIDGKPYLSPDYIVHHKDHNRLNNSVDNLELMTLAEHTKMHSKERAKQLAS